jgi:hypothetical protein
MAIRGAPWIGAGGPATTCYRESRGSPSLRARIREVNALDVALYVEAERLLDQQLAAVRRLRKACICARVCRLPPYGLRPYSIYNLALRKRESSQSIGP